MNLVDSSGWLEFFAEGPNADVFARPILRTAELVVPTMSLCEVFKKVLQQRDETSALRAVAAMRQGMVVVLDEALALGAARLSAETKLPMADSVMLATARATDATFWTQDRHFADFAGVKYIAAMG